MTGFWARVMCIYIYMVTQVKKIENMNYLYYYYSRIKNN